MATKLQIHDTILLFFYIPT